MFAMPKTRVVTRHYF